MESHTPGSGESFFERSSGVQWAPHTFTEGCDCNKENLTWEIKRIYLEHVKKMYRSKNYYTGKKNEE